MGPLVTQWKAAVDDVPTPNVQGLVFFADDPLPGNAASLVLNADTTITWDRDDIFLVISDEERKSNAMILPMAVV